MHKEYQEFLNKKSQINNLFGFKPKFIPDYLFDFQKSLVDWSVEKGRGAVLADCGLGKSIIELVWAQNIIEKTNKNILLLTPLAVTLQMEKEADKFGIEAKKSRDGKIKSKITITNYEQLHFFNPTDFDGIICDESGILKNFNGKIKNQINIFMRKIKYRLLATATAAPNDYIELGTSSEALGYLGYMDMLNKFFKNDMNNSSVGRYRGETVKWRLKGHAEKHFWRWVTSWARAVRFPSDIGFNDEGFILPRLIEKKYELNVTRPSDYGKLLSLPAFGLKEQREERRATLKDRCEKAADIANSINDYSVTWCNLNDEGDLLEKLISDSVQVSGRDKDEVKEEKLTAFSEGQIKKLIIKPKIGAWGLNWQHCNNIIVFPTHSYEQYYQLTRRCWRFGQERNVNVNLVFTKGDANMLNNLKRKQKQATIMFDNLIKEMNYSMSIEDGEKYKNKMEMPTWV